MKEKRNDLLAYFPILAEDIKLFWEFDRQLTADEILYLFEHPFILQKSKK